MTAEAERRPEYAKDEEEFRGVGVTVTEVTRPMALARRMPTDDGLLVTGVRPGRPFDQAKPSIRPGDVLLEVETVPLRRVKDLTSSLEGVKGEIAVRVRRGREDVICVVTVEEQKPPKRGDALEKAWLGIRTQVMTPKVAKAVGCAEQRGFRITRIYPDTEAKRSGLQIGDVLTAVDGEDLEAYRDQDRLDLVNRIEDEYSVGDTVQLGVRRGEERLVVAVKLEASPEVRRDVPKAKDAFFEFAVRDLKFSDRVARHLGKDQGGVIVTEVTSGGWAAMGGLRSEDLIDRIGGETVADVASFEKIIAGVVKARPAFVQLFVQRGTSTAIVVIEPEWK